jgi:NitT/TauT family transport system substrate-binding protein
MDRRTALLAVTGAALAAPFPRPAVAATTVRIAMIPSDSGSLIFSAQAAGYLDQANVVPDIQYLANGAASIAALVGGAIDVTGSNTLSVVQAREKGIPIKIIAPQAVYRRGEASTLLLVPKDSPARTGRDLNGKIVAVNALGGSPHVAVEAWIDQNGGDSASVKYLEMGFAAMGPAMAAKRIDAGILAEPALTNALGGARIFGDAYGAIAPYWMTDCLVAMESWIEEHADDVHRFSVALHNAAIWANRNRDKTAEIVAKMLKLDTATVRAMHRAVFAEQLTPAMIQPAIDAGVKYGAIPAPLRAEDLLSRELAAASAVAPLTARRAPAPLG